MKIQVLSEQVRVQQRVSKGSGKSFDIREQEALIEVGPQRILFMIGLDRDQAPYPKGFYVLADSCFEVDRFKRLSLKPFGRLDLVPFTSAVPVSPASSKAA